MSVYGYILVKQIEFRFLYSHLFISFMNNLLDIKYKNNRLIDNNDDKEKIRNKKRNFVTFY